MPLEFFPIDSESFVQNLPGARNSYEELYMLQRTLLRTIHAYTPAGYSDEILEDGAVIEGQWKNEDSSPYIQAFQPTRSKHATNAAENVTNILQEYFVGRGQLPW